MGIRTKIQAGINGTLSLTGWAELAESGGVTPGDGSASRTELNTRQGRHIIAENGLGELDRIWKDRSSRLSIGVEATGKVL